ncbi:hypothetical protein QBC35DRAFT_478289 [Podospora australis]|uniref:Uncharacterized protein n=1 Tax=Podospora australis TaxID=1536484 RepID=A0AAN6WJX7_9PEZI|nr:hypothetical protein QBC35DRAFT_478289 [Podospora australis]
MPMMPFFTVLAVLAVLGSEHSAHLLIGWGSPDASRAAPRSAGGMRKRTTDRKGPAPRGPFKSLGERIETDRMGRLTACIRCVKPKPRSEDERGLLLDILKFSVMASIQTGSEIICGSETIGIQPQM